MKLIGYVAHNLTLGLSASRTARLKNVTDDLLRRLIRDNLRDLERIVAWNIERGLLYYRISSNLIPYASHPANRIDWAGEFAADFDRIGRLIRDSGMVVSMHPGQYTVLSSPSQAVVETSLREIEYHRTVLERLGCGPEAKIIIHLGGAYDSKISALNRWRTGFNGLTKPARDSLAIENDGVTYTVADCLAVHAKLGVPVVFDVFHHEIQAGESEPMIAALKRCLDTWEGRPIKPEIHFSTQAAGKPRGAHAESIDLGGFLDFYRRTETLDFNIMLETKDKERSVLKIREALKATAA
jgi:UV DNA damage endonuclease